MKIQILILLFLLSNCTNKSSKLISYSETEKEQNQEVTSKKLKKTILKVIKYYNLKEEKKFNQLIHPKIGLYIIYRNGVYDFWAKIESLHFKTEWNDDAIIPYWLKDGMKNQTINTDYTIRKSSNRIVGCESVKAEGLFIIDNTGLKYILSNTIKQFIETGEVSKERENKLKINLEEIKKWEHTNQRIVLSIKEPEFYGNSFIFYLSKIDNNWYITVIDFITADCSA